MKTIALAVCLVVTAASGDVQWIPITPLDASENPKPDTDRSKLPHTDTLIERVKILQHLMDKGSKKDGDTKHEKGWYLLEPMEND